MCRQRQTKLKSSVQSVSPPFRLINNPTRQPQTKTLHDNASKNFQLKQIVKPSSGSLLKVDGVSSKLSSSLLLANAPRPNSLSNTSTFIISPTISNLIAKGVPSHTQSRTKAKVINHLPLNPTIKLTNAVSTVTTAIISQSTGNGKGENSSSNYKIGQISLPLIPDSNLLPDHIKNPSTEILSMTPSLNENSLSALDVIVSAVETQTVISGPADTSQSNSASSRRVTRASRGTDKSSDTSLKSAALIGESKSTVSSSNQLCLPMSTNSVTCDSELRDNSLSTVEDTNSKQESVVLPVVSVEDPSTKSNYSAVAVNSNNGKGIILAVKSKSVRKPKLKLSELEGPKSAVSTNSESSIDQIESDSISKIESISSLNTDVTSAAVDTLNVKVLQVSPNSLDNAKATELHTEVPESSLNHCVSNLDDFSKDISEVKNVNEKKVAINASIHTSQKILKVNPVNEVQNADDVVSTVPSTIANLIRLNKEKVISETSRTLRPNRKRDYSRITSL